MDDPAECEDLFPTVMHRWELQPHGDNRTIVVGGVGISM
jgi:hypothetical protein